VGDDTLFNRVLDDFCVSLEGGESRKNRTITAARHKKSAYLYLTEVLKFDPWSLDWTLLPEYQNREWDGSVNPLKVICDELSNGKWVGVESGTGTGKTRLAAGIGLWFLDAFENSLIITLAPKADQLKLNLWKEIQSLWPRFQARRPNATLDTMRIRVRPMRDEWIMLGFPVGVGADEESATKAQGFHAAHMLFIMEEMPGIDNAVLTAVVNTCVDPHNLILGLGNPDNQFDTLHQFCERDNVTHVVISALDHPNVVTKEQMIPGAVSFQKVEERKVEYGEESNLYLSRVRGQSPQQATDSLIRRDWLQKCVNKSVEERQLLQEKGEAALGLDVANSPKGDKSCVARGKGAVLLELIPKPCPDAAAWARRDVHPWIQSGGIRARRVGCDPIGVGGSAVNELTRLGIHIVGLNGGAKPLELRRTKSEKFLNLRAQMYWIMRLDVQEGKIALPDDDELLQDLTVVRWGVRGGKIYIEDKEEIRKKLKRSPDKGDSAVYWNFIRQVSFGATIGGASVPL
jgi:hypothetical protein